MPGELALEFMNMRAKDALAGQHGNLTPAAIQRCGRSLQGCNTILDGYTKGLEQYFGKPSNSTPSLQKDINMLVEVLKSEQLFKNVPGRQHRSFPAIKCKQTKLMVDRKERRICDWTKEKVLQCVKCKFD